MPLDFPLITLPQPENCIGWTGVLLEVIHILSTVNLRKVQESQGLTSCGNRSARIIQWTLRYIPIRNVVTRLAKWTHVEQAISEVHPFLVDKQSCGEIYVAEVDQLMVPPMQKPFGLVRSADREKPEVIRAAHQCTEHVVAHSLGLALVIHVMRRHHDAGLRQQLEQFIEG